LSFEAADPGGLRALVVAVVTSPRLSRLRWLKINLTWRSGRSAQKCVGATGARWGRALPMASAR